MAVDLLTRAARAIAGRAPWLVALALTLALVSGCSGARRYEAHGVVEAVKADEGQVVVAHDDIPGFMPAMTMSLDATPEVLAEVQPGQEIHFTLEVDDTSIRVVAAEVLGEAELGPDRMRLGDELVTLDPAPPFRLTDQLGEPLALSDLSGKAVLLDFVFTRCPGPCPILTSSHVRVQRELPPEVRERSHFVSISLDPLWDTPARLREYAAKRGVDFSDWSFLTGPPDVVEKVIRAYGVGSTRQPDGELVHLVVTFLIDPQGRIAKRYVGLDHGADEIVGDLEALLSAS